MEKIITEIKPHQEEGMRWIREREASASRGGMLLDEPGLGKTLIMLCVLSGDSDTPPKSTLIVAPASVMYVWMSEIAKHTTIPDSSVVLYHGSDRESKVNENTRVIVTSYGTLLSDFKRGFRTLWCRELYRVVLDEAHTIKNKDGKHAEAVLSLCCKMRWVVTATPIFNSPNDLYVYLHWLGFVGSFDEWKAIDSDAIRCLVVLNSIRRLKTDIPSLGIPPKMESDLNVTLTPAEKFLYNAVLCSMKPAITLSCQMIAELLSARQTPDVVERLTNATKSLHRSLIVVRQACSNQNVILQKMITCVGFYNKVCSGGATALVTTGEIKSVTFPTSILQCSMCVVAISTLMLSRCGHCVCDSCIILCKKNDLGSVECACGSVSNVVVKADYDFLRVRYLEEVYVPRLLESVPTTWSRVGALFEKIDYHIKRGRKVVVSSQWVTVVNELKERFEDTYPSLRCETITGKMPVAARRDVIDRFQTDRGTRAVFVSLMACSEGVTLTASSVIFHHDAWWNAEKTTQMTDRIHRIGQEAPSVHVYHLVNLRTIDEGIGGMVAMKKNDTGSLLDPEKTISSTIKNSSGLIKLAINLSLIY